MLSVLLLVTFSSPPCKVTGLPASVNPPPAKTICPTAVRKSFVFAGCSVPWNVSAWPLAGTAQFQLAAALQLPVVSPPSQTSGPFVLATKFAVTVILLVTLLSVRGSAALPSLQLVKA